MGQKIHPLGFRIGITEPHRSRWYAPKALFGELLIEDYRIREFIDQRLNRTPPFAAVAEIGIERTREELTIIIKTARPGLVIGPKGVEVERLQNDIQAMTGRKVGIKIVTIEEILEKEAEEAKKESKLGKIELYDTKKNTSETQHKDFIKLYFNEISKIPLLNSEEERDISRRVKKGDDEAKKRLIESNLRLVISIAKRFF